MTALGQEAEKILFEKSCSCPIYQTYSTVGEASHAWSHLLSLKVFEADDETPTVNLIDIVRPCGQPYTNRKFTFDNAEDLDKYLTSNPMNDRTRFM